MLFVLVRIASRNLLQTLLTLQFGIRNGFCARAELEQHKQLSDERLSVVLEQRQQVCQTTPYAMHGFVVNRRVT
jgi:hypothetical protein